MAEKAYLGSQHDGYHGTYRQGGVSGILGYALRVQ